MIDNKLPVYFVNLPDDDLSLGLNAVSLVEHPAVERNFLRFSVEKPVQLTFSVNEEKRIISGVSLLADTPIYRNNPEIGEYYIVFSADTIRDLVIRYSQKGLFNSVNLEHSQDRFVNGVYLIESYFTSKERNLLPKEFADVPDGSWFTSYYIEDDVLWNAIKADKSSFKGFSVEGWFDIQLGQEMSEEETFYADIEKILK